MTKTNMQTLLDVHSFRPVNINTNEICSCALVAKPVVEPKGRPTGISYLELGSTDAATSTAALSSLLQTSPVLLIRAPSTETV